MDNSFEAVWDAIAQHLHSGMVLRNWGVVRGYTGSTFEVKGIERTYITVAGGNMRMARRISKGGFEKVYSVWSAYVAGNHPRSKITYLSQNTTYILSIFREVLRP